jgi:hypothetical protein
MANESPKIKPPVTAASPKVDEEAELQRMIADEEKRNAELQAAVTATKAAAAANPQPAPRPSDKVQVQVLKHNPRAFVGGTYYPLMAGTTLEMPRAHAEALAEHRWVVIVRQLFVTSGVRLP